MEKHKELGRARGARINNALAVASQNASTTYLQDEYSVNKKRYFETLDILLSTLPENSHLLEIGCSPGLFTIALAQFQYSLYGIDLDPTKCLEFARNKTPIKRCDLDNAPIPFDDNEFDGVLFAEVVEHLHPFKIKSVLEEISRCLKAKGVLILSTPNLFALENRLFMLVGGTSALGGGITPSHHTREYGMNEITRVLQQTNFKIQEKHYSSARDLITVHESWKNIGRKLLFPAKKLIPSFRTQIFVYATKIQGCAREGRLVNKNLHTLLKQ